MFIDGDWKSYFFSLSWIIIIGCVFFGGRVKVRDDMAAFKPHDTLFLVLSLFFWCSVHEEKINTHQSDECVWWAMEQQATDRVSLELLPSRDPTPLTWYDFNLTAAEVYEVKKRLMNHTNLTQIHHRTKPSLLFWFIFQKTSTTKLQRCVLPFFLSVVFVCCECEVNKTLLHGQVHSEWIGWEGTVCYTNLAKWTKRYKRRDRDKTHWRSWINLFFIRAW